jgi:hypothetical protein
VSALPSPDDLESLLLRTDFSDDLAWSSIRSAIAQPIGRFRANIKFVDDRQYEDLTIERLLELVLEGSDQTFIFLVDRETMRSPEHPVLVVDLFEERGRFVRVIPSEMWSIQNNLCIGNMDWDDFASSADADGVFRGFK